MSLPVRKVCYVLLPLGVLFLQGCGGGGGRDMPDTVNVSGTIYLDGNPLPDALVTFTSNEFSSAGRTNSEGRYTLAQGAVPGKNTVTIEKWEGGELKINPEEGMDEGQFEAMLDPEATGKAKVDLGPKQLIPEHYSDPEKSDLTYDVPEGGAKDADFRLQGE